MYRPLIKLLIPATIVAVLFFWPLHQKTPLTNHAMLGCAGPVSEKTLSDKYDPQTTKGEFQGKIVQIPPIYFNTQAQILGENSDNKHIEVDLSRQRVYAYEDNTRIFDFLVSTGKWYPTPKGTFSIATKVYAQKMSGGSKELGTYYYLPNVPWVMFFGNSQIPWNRGFSFHGTYWHNNFGHPMSHGCINMTISDAKTLYNWAPVGTRVVIY